MVQVLAVSAVVIVSELAKRLDMIGSRCAIDV